MVFRKKPVHTFTESASTRLGGWIRENLKEIVNLTDYNWDGVIIITGEEGDGKTTFAKTGSYFLDSKTNINRWAYNAEQFEKAVDRDDVEPGTNIIWDESDELTGHWASQVVVSVKRKLKRIRKKRLIIWLITPTFFDINKYFAVKRPRCLIDVYAEPKYDSEGNFQPNRGRLRFFNRKRLKQLYFKGKKEWDMNAVQPIFVDSFSNPPPDYPVSEEELEKLKDDAMKSIINEDKKTKSAQYVIPDYRQNCIYRLEKFMLANYGRELKNTELAYIFKCSDRIIWNDKKIIKQNIVELEESLRKTTEERDADGFGLAEGSENVEAEAETLTESSHNIKE